MLVHVICCNDAVEYAVVNDEARAFSKMEELKNADFAKWDNPYKTMDQYKGTRFWHCHTVNGE